MTIEKCIKEFGVDDVIFEEGSTGRELFVVLDGKVDIAKIDRGNKTVIVSLGKGEFFGEMAVIDGSARSATARSNRFLLQPYRFIGRSRLSASTDASSSNPCSPSP